jgi:hypothetical protein
VKATAHRFRNQRHERLTVALWNQSLILGPQVDLRPCDTEMACNITLRQADQICQFEKFSCQHHGPFLRCQKKVTNKRVHRKTQVVKAKHGKLVVKRVASAKWTCGRERVTGPHLVIASTVCIAVPALRTGNTG